MIPDGEVEDGKSIGWVHRVGRLGVNHVVVGVVRSKRRRRRLAEDVEDGVEDYAQ
jgi:hypothetical protein